MIFNKRCDIIESLTGICQKRLGVGVEDVIFPDDNFNAIKTAKVAGMHVYGVYDDSSKEYVEEMTAISERYIRDFSELL